MKLALSIYLKFFRNLCLSLFLFFPAASFPPLFLAALAQHHPESDHFESTRPCSPIPCSLPMFQALSSEEPWNMWKIRSVPLSNLWTAKPQPTLHYLDTAKTSNNPTPNCRMWAWWIWRTKILHPLKLESLYHWPSQGSRLRPLLFYNYEDENPLPKRLEQSKTKAVSHSSSNIQL